MEQKSYTKKELRVLMEATGYPMASIEKTMRLLELLRAINEDAFLSDLLSFSSMGNGLALSRTSFAADLKLLCYVRDCHFCCPVFRRSGSSC